MVFFIFHMQFSGLPHLTAHSLLQATQILSQALGNFFRLGLISVTGLRERGVDFYQQTSITGQTIALKFYIQAFEGHRN